MGRRRSRAKAKDGAGEGQHQKSQEERHQEPAIRLLSVHPHLPIAAVAVGTSVRICDYKSGQQLALGTADVPCHSAALRALQFSPDGKYILTGADDKTTKLWSAESRQLLRTWKTPKKVSACAFTLDGAHALFADRFGDVKAEPTAAASSSGTPPADAAAPQVPATMLGHFCAIITSLSVSQDGRLLASCDKDFKVRITQIPADPSKGAYVIESYCMGHNEFVAGGAFVPQPAGSAPQHLFVSGSGDGSVRLWDAASGQQLHSLVVSQPDEQLDAAAASGSGTPAAGEAMDVDAAAGGKEEDGEDEKGEGEDSEGEGEGDGEAGPGDGDEPVRERKGPSCAPVLSLAVSPDGRHVAVAVEGEDEVQVLGVQRGGSGSGSSSSSPACLVPLQRLHLPSVRYPCHVQYDPAGRLWLLGGAPIPNSLSVHLGVAAWSDAAGAYAEVSSQEVASAAHSLLESRVEAEEAELQDGGALCSYSQRLKRKRYTEAEREKRKFPRRDLIENERLRKLRADEDAVKAAAPASS